jgi:murein DD-endopeptidase MepM/ murein hydrolase activator NlpD
MLGADAFDEWQFEADAGQSATIEMWFHPGSGSSVEAELMIQLIAPDGATLAEKRGNVFLPPYLFEASLPDTGLYHLQVLPISGSPGRYSLALALSDGPTLADTGDAGSRPTTAPPANSQMPAVSQFDWPSTRRAISGWTFHDPGNPGHIGLDIDAEMWDPIMAAADGTVVFASWGGGYGNLVIVEHEGGWSSYYAHLTEIGVGEGQNVRQGDTLGAAGTTGYSTGPHLHFELRYKGRPVDPHVHLP